MRPRKDILADVKQYGAVWSIIVEVLLDIRDQMRQRKHGGS